ncbi:MAG: acyl-CoA carboxylase subunit beta [Bacteroidetes bacterium]|nr:acyl-CoA carboxylase subunit beta [Bacteroidota bacterium]MCH8246867.1 acyl-CoA carboxylase subunit beta [Bacteroidota bacterium]
MPRKTGLGRELNLSSKSVKTRTDSYIAMISELNRRRTQVAAGGGKKRQEREHKRGKLLARERVSRLLDEGSEFHEIGSFAAYGMYEEDGGCPSAGTVVGLGHVSGRLCIIVANDATVKAGAWFPMTTKKNLRAQEIALENRIPIIYLVDSAGVYLPMQDEVFPDRDHFGRIFRNNAVLSRLGVPQISAIMGSCVAGGAYLPIMSDEALIVEGTGSVFLAGPFLVKAAIGETAEKETLGGAATHSQISGVTDYQMADDDECLATIRELIGRLGEQQRAGFDRIESVEPAFAPEELYGLLPISASSSYDMRDVLARIVDAESWTEYKEGYGKTIITGYARIDGWSVGIVANQRLVVRAKSGVKSQVDEMQAGGVIYSDSADKAARFIMICNQKKIPLVFFQDVTGFMVGSRAEHGGIIKDGAKMVSAVANSVVPKFTVVVGNSYGAGNYAMCGRAYDPRLILAWPTARIAVMGGAQAAETLMQIQATKREREGEELSEEERAALLTEIQERYDSQTSPYYAAARLWVDELIDPIETRSCLSTGLEMANHNPDIPPFSPGIIQT